jgi:hypothetical protein
MIYFYWFIGIFVYFWVGNFFRVNFKDSDLHDSDSPLMIVSWPFFAFCFIIGTIFKYIFIFFNKITPKL